MPPKLIITRPTQTASRFSTEVQALLSREVACIFSPAYDIQFLNFDKAQAKETTLIFTSANGVAAAKRVGLKGQRAWCVGDRTAAAATDAGFRAHSANGDVEALLAAILASGEDGAMTHIAGTFTRGDLVSRLTAHGILCDQITAYRQNQLSPSDAYLAASKGSDPLVIPLFSPRAALMVGIEFKAPVHVVAMSKAICDAAIDMNVDTVVTVRAPTNLEMVRTTCDLLSKLFDRTG